MIFCACSHSIRSDRVKNTQAVQNCQQRFLNLIDSGLIPSQEFLMVTEQGTLPNLCVLAVIKHFVSIFSAIRVGKFYGDPKNEKSVYKSL